MKLKNILTNVYVCGIMTYRKTSIRGDFVMDKKETALVFKAFCDENRIRILEILSDGEKCACRLLEELSVTQPTLSHHMKVLCDSGVVVSRKDGKWMYYSLSKSGIEKAQNYLLFLANSREEK